MGGMGEWLSLRKRRICTSPTPDLVANQKKVQSTPDNSNLQGKLKKGTSCREFELSAVENKGPEIRENGVHGPVFPHNRWTQDASVQGYLQAE